MVNTFKLSDLNQNFWEKVLFIQIIHSSGLGGPGAIWIITSEMKLFFIGLSELPYNEWTDLGKLCPLLEKTSLTDGRAEFKAVSMGYKYSPLGNVLVKEEYFAKYEKIWRQVYDKDLYKINYVHEPDVMKLVLDVDSFERFDLKDTVKRYEREEREHQRLKKEHNERKLTADYLDWKPIYYNNAYTKCMPENGIYCLLLKDVDGYANGLRISIKYQFVEEKPFCRRSNATIEQYILYKKDYGIIDGKLSFGDPKASRSWSSKYYCLQDTLDYCDLNSSGEFVRAFKTLDEAKEYALAVADRAQYNKENLIDASDNEMIRKYEFKSMSIKHQTIQEFGKNYKEIMKLAAEYEFPDECSGGGWYLCNEIVEKLGIDGEIAKRMLEYIPQILLPRHQRKSKEIYELCRKEGLGDNFTEQ